MPRTPRNPDGINNSPIVSRKEERYLHCTQCDMSITLMLAPGEDRPMHRCQAVYKAMPFNQDLPGHKAPKGKRWFEEKEKHPRPRATRETRPRIVL